MTFDDFAALCLKRHSVRYFQDVPVPREQILQLLHGAVLAPNIENTQPWHFHIVEDRKLLRSLMAASCYGNFIEGASVFIVVSCDTTAQPSSKEIIWNPRELEYSCVAAMENILLGAVTMGLGGCFVSLHHGTAHQLLNLPHHRAIVGGIMLGHPHASDAPAAEHARKKVEEMYTIY